MNENITKINYYPGHMAKTKRQILENINLIDIVYVVVMQDVVASVCPNF